MKKAISSLLALSILFCISAHVFADAPANNADKILASVKNRITISFDYNAFVSDSYTDENGTEYTFSWEGADKSIKVTANESGIISDYIYTEPDSQKPSIKNS